MENHSAPIPQIPISVNPNLPAVQEKTDVALEEEKCGAFSKPAQFYDAKEKRRQKGRRFPAEISDHHISNDATAKTHRSKRVTESPKNSLGDSRNSSSGFRHEESPENNREENSARKMTDRAKLKERSSSSKSRQTFDQLNEKFRNDATCESTTTAEDGWSVEQSRRKTFKTVGKFEVNKVKKHSRVPENKTFSTTSKNVESTAIAPEDNLPRKKKTDGQRKQEYKNKVKLLPSVQGKVLTVTPEFYNLATQNESKRVHLLTKNNDSEDVSFGLNDFPALGETVEDQKLIRSFKKNCSTKGSQDSELQTDSDWSDVDSHEHKTLKNEIKPRKSTIKKSSKLNEAVAGSSTDMPKMGTYAASVKKSNDPLRSHDHISGSSIGSNPLEPSTSSRKPKAKSLIEFNLVTMLNKSKVGSKDINRKPGVAFKEEKKMGKVKPVVGNILDSTAPTRRRGKERETPAKKKLTPMKKIILKERETRKLTKSAPAVQLNEENNFSVPTDSIDSPPEDGNELKHVHCVENQEELRSENNDVKLAALDVQKRSIHTRKFREYCNQMLNPEIDETVTKLIQDLIRFQDRLYQKDPIKAKMRRRMVVGLREVTKHLKMKKLKCIVLAPNVEKSISDGGLDEAMASIISMAVEQEVPFVFALGRSRLGRVCLKKSPVSGVGIFNYEGSEANFKHLCTLATDAQEAYQEATRQDSTL